MSNDTEIKHRCVDPVNYTCSCESIVYCLEEAVAAGVDMSRTGWRYSDIHAARMRYADRKDTNPKDQIGRTKLSLGLVPDTAVAYMALAFTEGDCKYGAYNYRVAGVSAAVYHDACRRHLAKWWNGEWADQTTGIPHIASAMACLAVVADAHEGGKLTDDRPPVAPVSTQIDTYAEHIAKIKELYTPRYTLNEKKE